MKLLNIFWSFRFQTPSAAPSSVAILMAAILSPSRGKVLERALRSPTVVTLPSFLVPAFQTVPTRQFSATTQRPSKLGRTPLAIPPGVEVTIGEPVIKKDATSYRQIAKRTVTVSGPLGMPPDVAKLIMTP